MYSQSKFFSLLSLFFDIRNSTNFIIRGESNIDFRTQCVIMTQQDDPPPPVMCVILRISTKSIVF